MNDDKVMICLLSGEKIMRITRKGLLKVLHKIFSNFCMVITEKDISLSGTDEHLNCFNKTYDLDYLEAEYKKRACSFALLEHFRVEVLKKNAIDLYFKQYKQFYYEKYGTQLNELQILEEITND